MRPLRSLSYVLAVLAVLAIVMGGLGFSSVSAERGVQVAVVDDAEAFVGYQSEDVTDVKEGETIPLVKVTNRFETDVNVTEVVVKSGNPEQIDVDVKSTPSNIDPGESGTIRGRVDQCEWSSSAEITATVTVKGKGIRATLFGEGETVDREFTVTCESPIDSVEFYGAGNARIYGPAESVWTKIKILEKQSGSLEKETLSANTSSSLRSQLNRTPSDYTIVGVGISGESGYYVHPAFNTTSCTLESPYNTSSVTTPDTDPFKNCE
ncbi:MAG: hypothetical protein ABEJ58_01695 [Halodesulfurarchaeum sp.]